MTLFYFSSILGSFGVLIFEAAVLMREKEEFYSESLLPLTILPLMILWILGLICMTLNGFFD